MRLEKPHSLSYHDATRHSLPSTTWVWVRSKMELAGLWLKSADTSGASLTVRVLYNPAYFFLGADEVDNYRKLDLWAQHWRRHETESFVAGGEN